MSSVIVWDIETVPDLKGFAAANGHDGKSDEEIRAAMGDKFPKHIYHSIICIGALVAHREDNRWVVDALGAPHIAERTEKALISSFLDRIAELSPQLVTTVHRSTCLSCGTAQRSMALWRQVYRRGCTLTGTPRMREAASCRAAIMVNCLLQNRVWKVVDEPSLHSRYQSGS
jgi:hypothetical protein